MTEIKRFADKTELAQAAAEQFATFAQNAIKARGQFSVALSGGSTPKTMHHILAEQYGDRVDWSKVHVFWGDERTVPPDDPDSNYRMAKETLLDAIQLPAENIHRIHAELDPQKAAKDYEGQLRNFFGEAEPYPRFDLIFMGMGDDGHTASLFPGTQALQEKTRWVVANHVEKLDTWRITLTAPVINAAAIVIFLVAGEDKADPLREVINGPYLPETYPSQLIEPTSGDLLWLIDEAAGALL